MTNHDTMLDKLNSYGIRGESDLRLKTYLSNRLQFVELKESV
jgi:hypothetical protein